MVSADAKTVIFADFAQQPADNPLPNSNTCTAVGMFGHLIDVKVEHSPRMRSDVELEGSRSTKSSSGHVRGEASLVLKEMPSSDTAKVRLPANMRGALIVTGRGAHMRYCWG